MIRRDIEVKHKGTVTLVYDNNKYDIQYNNVDNDNVFIVIRKEDGKVLKVFPSTIGFIRQVNEKIGNVEQNDFYVSEYVDEHKPVYLRSYLYMPSQQGLCTGCSSRMEIESPNYDDICLGEGAFKIGLSGNYYIYSSLLGRKSRLLKRIYNSKYDFENKDDESLKNTVLVKEVYASEFDADIPEFSDIVTYGINPDTLKITTKIYSKAQDRFIDLYNDEEIDVAMASCILGKYARTFFDKSGSNIDPNGVYTLLYSVVVPFEQRVESNKKENIVSKYSEIKESFVKKIGEKKEV